MNNFWSIIPKNVLKNRKRSFFIALTIMLSVSLIVSLKISLSFFINGRREALRGQDGGIYDSIITAHYDYKEDFDYINKEKFIKEQTQCFFVGDAIKVGNGKKKVKIIGFDKEKASTMLNVKIIKGREPGNANEIALEDWIVKRIDPNLKIGDKVKIPVVPKDYDNYKKLNEFTLVGIFNYEETMKEDNKLAKAYVNKEYVKSKFPKDLIYISEFIKYKEDWSIDKNIQRTIMDLTNGMEFYKNYNRYMFYKSVNIINYVSKVLNIVILIIGTILIYNVFISSITERTRELGMLRALGLTSKESRILVIGEGVIIALIVIPLAIFLGSFLSRISMSIMSKENHLKDILLVPSDGIKQAIAVGILSVILGANSASRKAAKISPIEAMNNLDKAEFDERVVKEISMKMEDEPKGFLFSMAKINLNRNKKKFISTVISMSMSVVLFIVISFIMISIDPIKGYKKKFGGDFIIQSYNYAEGEFVTEKDIERIEKIDGVEKVHREKTLMTNAIVTQDLCTFDVVKEMEIKATRDIKMENFFKDNKCYIPVEVMGCDEKELKNLRKYKKEGSINTENISGRTVTVMQKIGDKEEKTKFKIGDKVDIEAIIYNEKTKKYSLEMVPFEVEGIIETKEIEPKDNSASCIFMVSDKTMINSFGLNDYQRANITLDKNADYKKVEKQLKEIAKNNRNYKFRAYEEELKGLKKNLSTVHFIFYSFIFMVGLISILNIFNTMNMNVILRKKEFGMFRAIGMSKHEVRKMVIKEGVFYGIWTCVWGVILSVGSIYAVSKVMKRTLISTNFLNLILTKILPVALLVAILSFIAALNASRKVFSDSIIESMRGIE